MSNNISVTILLGWGDNEDCDLSDLHGANLCELAMPIPEKLMGIISSDEPFRYRHKETGEVWTKDCNGPSGDEGRFYEGVKLTDEEKEELQRSYGGTSWYEWCNSAWGTKWGTYNTEVIALPGDMAPKMLAFECAWAPPSEAARKAIESYLEKTYEIQSFVWSCHDPYDCTVATLSH